MIEFKAATNVFWDDRVSILALQRDGLGKIAAIVKPVQLTLEKHEAGALIECGTLELDAESARSLMNALWSAGLRPADFKNPNGEINRLEAHLEDMRRLVFVTSGDAANGEERK